MVYFSATCAIEATRPRLSTQRFAQSTGMLEPNKRVADDKFFAQYHGCVCSNRNAQGSAELRAEMDLSLEEARGATSSPHAPSSRFRAARDSQLLTFAK